MTLGEFKIGQFVEKNKHVFYRYRIEILWLYDAYLHIDKHPSISVHDGKLDNWQLIENPERKHVNNAIAMLKNELEKGSLDNLTYVENLNILRNYLKSDIIDTE